MEDPLRSWWNKVKDRLRSWWDVNIFTLSTLHPPSIPLVIVSAFVFLAGIALWIGDLVSSAWVGVIIGFLGLAKDVLSLTMRWFFSPDVSLKKDDGIPRLLSRLQLTLDYTEEGYRIVSVPYRPDEYVVRSSQVDSYLRSHDVSLQEHQELLNPINEILRRNSRILEDALRCQYRGSWREDQRFFNETKTCLGQDLFQRVEAIQIFRGSYFHSFLTNELVTRTLESKGPRPTTLYRGSAHFPSVPSRGGVFVLKPIRESLMANHIGISTVVHTSDRLLPLWRQSIAAQQSQDLLAPTGSGSIDWSDWTNLSGGKTLTDVIARAMEREFREESHRWKSALEGVAIRTRLLGFYRWVRRGGKPEFVGISKIGAPWSALEPNVAEVDAPAFLQLTYPASTLNQLRDSVAGLLDSDHLSVPLWVNLTCLEEALKTEPDQWAEFLEIGW